MGIFLDCATIASTWHVPSGPKNAATPSQIMSVIAFVASTVSPLVSFHLVTNVTFGKIFGFSLTYR